jgi:Phage integrase family
VRSQTYTDPPPTQPPTGPAGRLPLGVQRVRAPKLPDPLNRSDQGQSLTTLRRHRTNAPNNRSRALDRDASKTKRMSLGANAQISAVSAEWPNGRRGATANEYRTRGHGQPLRVVAHQLRHTWATELANAGMSIQALMTLLGHRSPEMTIRYARLASPTLKAVYDQAIGKIRPRIPVAPAGRPAIPDRVEWLAAEMLKTRVAHGYCSRDLAADACPNANICETCPNYVTTTDFAPAIAAQLDDIRQLRNDAEARGWTSETTRHQRVITSLEAHLRRLNTNHTTDISS